jgi:hypothetical protein
MTIEEAATLCTAACSASSAPILSGRRHRRRLLAAGLVQKGRPRLAQNACVNQIGQYAAVVRVVCLGGPIVHPVRSLVLS